MDKTLTLKSLSKRYINWKRGRTRELLSITIPSSDPAVNAMVLGLVQKHTSFSKYLESLLYSEVKER